MKYLRWLTVALLLSSCAYPLRIRTEEAAAARPLLIDVRTPAEWQEGHLEGAILVPYENIGGEIEKIAPDRKTKINLYCRSGRRSGIALDALKAIGYEDVTNFGSVKEASEKLQIPVVK